MLGINELNLGRIRVGYSGIKIYIPEYIPAILLSGAK